MSLTYPTPEAVERARRAEPCPNWHEVVALTRRIVELTGRPKWAWPEARPVVSDGFPLGRIHWWLKFEADGRVLVVTWNARRMNTAERPATVEELGEA